MKIKDSSIASIDTDSEKEKQLDKHKTTYNKKINTTNINK